MPDARQDAATEQESSVGTDASEHSAPVGAEQPKISKWEAELLQSAREDGMEVGLEPRGPAPVYKDEPLTEEVENPSEVVTTKTTEVSPQETESESETEEEKEELPASAHAEVWPDSAKKRVAEETAKRKERTEQLEKANAKVAELESKLLQANSPKPTPDNPFIDVYDLPTLRKLDDQYEKVLRDLEIYSAGAGDPVVGKNEDGTEVHYSELEPNVRADMKYKADKAIRKDIPMRAAFLAEREKGRAVAEEIYPDLKNRDSEFAQLSFGILQQNPILEAVLGNEALIWIGHALKGRELHLQNLSRKNGKDTSETVATRSVNRLVESANTRIAPATVKTRSFPERKGADLETANKNLEREGTQDAADAYLNALWARKRQPSRRAAVATRR